MNRGEWRQAAEYFAEDVQHHRGNWQNGTEAIVRGKKVLTDNLEDIFRTFPDWKMEIVEVAAEGDSVIVRCRVSGTHRGVATRAVNGGLLVGVQPTGKHFQVQHIHGTRLATARLPIIQRAGMISECRSNSVSCRCDSQPIESLRQPGQ